MGWLVSHWPHILVGIGIFSVLCMGLGKYMEENDVKWDDGAAKVFKWLGGVGNVIVNVFKAQKK